MRQISTVIGEPIPDVQDQLRDYIANNKNFDVIGETKDGANLIELVRTHKPELVIISKDLKNLKEMNMDGLEICRLIMGEFPSTVIIVTAPFEEPQDLRDSMKAGARDFIAVGDFGERLVDSAIELITSIRKYDVTVSDKKGKVISLVSPKGGVGKTTISFNIAAEISKRLQNRPEPGRVLLLDYDLQFGDISYLGNLKPTRTIADLNEMREIDQDALEAHLVEHPTGGFWVLAAPMKPHYADIIRPEILQKTIEIGKRLFDYIIIDSMQGFHPSSMVAIDQSDIVAVVTGSQLVSLKNTKLTIETLEELIDHELPKDKIKIIVNKYDKLSIPVEEIPKRFKYDLLGCVPKNDGTVSQANNYNKFIVSDYGNTDVARGIKHIVDNIFNIFEPVETSQKNKGNKGNKANKGSLLNTLFGK